MQMRVGELNFTPQRQTKTDIAQAKGQTPSPMKN